MDPRNPLRVKEALLSLLAGDIYGKTPIWPSLCAFKALYYAYRWQNPRRTFAAWRRRRCNIRDTGPLRGETFIDAVANRRRLSLRWTVAGCAQASLRELAPRSESMLGTRSLCTRVAGRNDLRFARLNCCRRHESMIDAWFSSGRRARTEQPAVRYATDGQWLHGHVQIDDRRVEGGLRAATQRAYSEMFALLATNGCPHVLRLWNYFADINIETDGLERYRQFNVGRQQAFLDAGRSAFEGAPAACALGTRTGPLHVYFLAGRSMPIAIENPRQVSAYRYPDKYGPRTPTFSRAALAEVGGARLALFVSGTASIVDHTTVHIGDVRRQTEECLANIDAVLQAAALRACAPFAAAELSYTVNVRHPQTMSRPCDKRSSPHVGPDSPAARNAIYLLADICRADLLVEIEAHGFAPYEGDA